MTWTWCRSFARFGEHDVRIDDGLHEDVGIEQFEWHEDFDPDSLENDIAILILERNVDFNGNAQVCFSISSFCFYCTSMELIFTSICRSDSSHLSPNYRYYRRTHWPSLCRVNSICGRLGGEVWEYKYKISDIDASATSSYFEPKM